MHGHHSQVAAAFRHLDRHGERVTRHFPRTSGAPADLHRTPDRVTAGDGEALAGVPEIARHIRLRLEPVPGRGQVAARARKSESRQQRAQVGEMRRVRGNRALRAHLLKRDDIRPQTLQRLADRPERRAPGRAHAVLHIPGDQAQLGGPGGPRAARYHSSRQREHQCEHQCGPAYVSDGGRRSHHVVGGRRRNPATIARFTGPTTRALIAMSFASCPWIKRERWPHRPPFPHRR